MIPRFIISMRELYDRDLRDRWQGIDTGFGVLPESIASENAAVSTVAFTDTSGHDQIVEGNVDDSEGIQLVAVGDGARQV